MNIIFFLLQAKQVKDFKLHGNFKSGLDVNINILPVLSHDPLKNVEALYVVQPVRICCGVLSSPSPALTRALQAPKGWRN